MSREAMATLTAKREPASLFVSTSKQRLLSLTILLYSAQRNGCNFQDKYKSVTEQKGRKFITSRCYILYIFIQQIYILNILNMVHTLRFFLFKMPFIS